MEMYVRHWKGNVIILMKFPSLSALEVVKLTTSSAANDENFVKMTFPFQWAESPLVTQFRSNIYIIIKFRADTKHA